MSVLLPAYFIQELDTVQKAKTHRACKQFEIKLAFVGNYEWLKKQAKKDKNFLHSFMLPPFLMQIAQFPVILHEQTLASGEIVEKYLTFFLFMQIPSLILMERPLIFMKSREKDSNFNLPIFWMTQQNFRQKIPYRQKAGNSPYDVP